MKMAFSKYVKSCDCVLLKKTDEQQDLNVSDFVYQIFLRFFSPTEISTNVFRIFYQFIAFNKIIDLCKPVLYSGG